MKKLLKVISVLMVFTLLTVSLGACGDKKVTSGETSELTVFMLMSPTPYSEDMPIWKKAAEITGITLKNVVSSVSSNQQMAYTTMLASGELPDIIRNTALDLRKLAIDGGMIPLTDLIEEHAPNIKKFFEDCPEAKAIATVDGEIYFIPGSLSGIDTEGRPTTGYFIRQDWLDKLGLKVPTTIDELYNVLKAFKTQDPNGNGLEDEVPFFQRDHQIGQILGLWDTSAEFRKTENGKSLEYSPLTEKYKEAMKVLAKWYKEGLIDKEFFTRSSAREQLFGQNLGGFTIDWFSSTGKFNETVHDTVPGFNLQPMLPPADINGDIKHTGGAILHSAAWGISSDCAEEKIIDAVKYLDFWMSEEGQQLISWGVENVSYVYDENGKKVWTEEAKNYESGVPNYLRSIGNCEIGSIGDIESEKAGMNEISLKGYEMYEKIVSATYGKLAFTVEEQAVIDKYATNISTLNSEWMQKWIFGKADVDATWNTYIDQMNVAGANEYVKAYTSAYERMYGKL